LLCSELGWGFIGEVPDSYWLSALRSKSRNLLCASTTLATLELKFYEIGDLLNFSQYSVTLFLNFLTGEILIVLAPMAEFF
jgi:hypothetical protein